MKRKTNTPFQKTFKPEVAWVTLRESYVPVARGGWADVTIQVRRSVYMNGWVWSDRFTCWFVPEEYTLATPAEILKAKLLGE